MGNDLLKAAINRAIRTVCQVALANIGTAATMGEVNWNYLISTCAVSGIISVLMSFATGLPETDEGSEKM